MSDLQQLILGAIQGLASSTVFVLVLMIGFCVVVGFTKLKKTAGGRIPCSDATYRIRAGAMKG